MDIRSAPQAIEPELIAPVHQVTWWRADETFPEEGPFIEAPQRWWDRLFELIIEGQKPKQACQIASLEQNRRITWDALREAAKAFPELGERMELAKQQVNVESRRKIGADVRADVGTAKWFLERRDEQFRPRSRVDLGKVGTGDLIDALDALGDGEETDKDGT